MVKAEPAATSTLAVDRDIADQVRSVAKKAGCTALEVTNQLLKYGLAQGEIKIETRVVTVTGSGKKPAARR